MQNTAATKRDMLKPFAFVALYQYHARWFLTSSLTAYIPKLNLEKIWEMKEYQVRCSCEMPDKHGKPNMLFSCRSSN